MKKYYTHAPCKETEKNNIIANIITYLRICFFEDLQFKPQPISYTTKSLQGMYSIIVSYS